jgi:hypothetical protein
VRGKICSFEETQDLETNFLPKCLYQQSKKLELDPILKMKPMDLIKAYNHQLGGINIPKKNWT